jgi:tRNA threonylcarbamoyladenosine biosynthesis protein TsaB
VLHESLLGLSAQGRPQHAALLLEEVERAATAAGGWDGVDLIATGLGPGSFTGLRIAIATAKGLAASTGLPLAGICTLDAIARGLAAAAVSLPRTAQRDSGGLAVLDARRGEVFAALYGEGGERLWEPFVGSPEELVERIAELPQPPRAAGSGALRFRQELARRGVEVPGDADPVHRVAARHICALAAAGRARGARPPAPIYLRPPDAVRWRERDTLQTAK